MKWEIGIGCFCKRVCSSFSRDNVCVEREETTDDDDDVEEVGAGAKNRSKTPKFFSTAISLSNCQQTPNKYECTTK